MTPKKLKEFLGLSQKHMATLLNEDYKKYRSLQRRVRKPIDDALRLFQYVSDYRRNRGLFETPQSISDCIEPQQLGIYVLEDLQKSLNKCADEIMIYQKKLSKLEAQLSLHNKEFAVVMELQVAVPEEELDLHDRITLLKRQLSERYTSYYYLLIQRKQTLNWKVIEYNMLVQEMEHLNNHKNA
jgi:sulfur carrier protein ThiS